MKQIVPIVLTALMLSSLFAGIDFADELKDTNEMETSGRAAYEITLHDVLEPRETFVDQAGNTRNGIDIGDTVYFRPIIINDGDNDHNEFNVRVTVTPAGDGQTALINNLDPAVCAGATSVTGCSYNNLPSGDFLAGGNYRVQAESGGDLSWTPTVVGTYVVTVAIEVDSTMDDDLTNNDMTTTVIVQNYRDIVLDLCWTDGPTGECLADGAGYDNAQGAGPHNFMLTMSADGSEAWQPRNTMVNIMLGGDFDTAESRFDNQAGSSWNFAVGETATVDVWHNVTNPDQTVTDANDLADNPCTNGDNPCAQSRTVMVFQTEYVYRGLIKGEEASGGGSAPSSYSVTAGLVTYDSYEPSAGADGGGPMSNGSAPSQIMKETTLDYDDRTGNNDGELMGYFTVFHDIGLTSLTAGVYDATEGTLNVGMTRLKANVVYGGSATDNAYDWSVTFTVTDDNGQDALNGAPGIAADCLDETEDSYDHMLLSQTAIGALPQGTACLDVDFQPGRFTVTATVNMISETSTPSDATDMNSGNNQRGTFFEVINEAPRVYMTLDAITRDGADVDAPIVAGDFITMRARGTDTETDDMALLYTWSRVTAGQEVEPMMTCDQSICNVETDMSWIGERMVTVTVTDGNGATATDSMLISVWNTYSVDMTVTGATMSYSLIYGPMANYNVSAADADQVVGATLGDNAATYTSTVAFELTVTNIWQVAEIGTETMTVDFEGDANQPWSLWFKRGEGTDWTPVDYVTATAGTAGGVTMTMSHDGSASVNMASGTYAVFDVASSAAFPPATGVTGLTADLNPAAQVVFNWGYGDDSLLGGADTVTLYTCTGVDCTLDMNSPVFVAQPTTTTWTLVGVDATAYTVLVQTENGNIDAVSGAKLTGGSASMDVVADGSVSPAPTISNAEASVGSDSLTFTWDATEGDVDKWVLCWAGTQDIVENDFSSLLGTSCAETDDVTKSLTVNETAMCGAACNAKLYFGIAAMDDVGNVGDSGGLMVANMADGITQPGLVPADDKEGNDGSMPSEAIYAIIILVVLAVIGGAFILTRGGGVEGDDKEWDY